MKDLKLLVWLMQLGLSVAVPPVLLIWLAVWLQDKHGWGGWVLWAGILLGALLTFDGLRVSLRTLHRLSEPKETEKPPVSSHDHD